MYFPVTSLSRVYPYSSGVRSLPVRNLFDSDQFILDLFDSDSDCANENMILSLISESSTRVNIPSASKNMPTGGLWFLSFLAISIPSTTFLANLETDFVTIRSYLSLRQSSIIWLNCTRCFVDVAVIPSSAKTCKRLQFLCSFTTFAQCSFWSSNEYTCSSWSVDTLQYAQVRKMRPAS